MATRVVHLKKEKFDINIGRPSPFGNPYSYKDGTLAKYKVATREEAVIKYEEYILGNIKLLSYLRDLHNKILGCWCKPLACHGDILAKLADLPNFPQYCFLLDQMLEARNFGLEDVEDKLLDEMDEVWNKMTTEEHEYAKKVSKLIDWRTVHSSTIDSGNINNTSS